MMFKGIDLAVEVDDFHGDLQLVADQCGVDAALALHEKAAGVSIYLGNPGTPDYEFLTSICDEEKLNALMQAFFGMILYIPKTPSPRLAKKYIDAVNNGRNINEIAVALNLSKQMVYRLIATPSAEALSEEDDEPTLFDNICK